MKIGVLGTGMVGSTLATGLVEAGHDVMMGSRTPDNQRAVDWAASAGASASHGTFADSAAFGEIVFNCTSGAASLDALRAAGADNLRDKTLVDVANPLDFSEGMPPTFTVCNDDSLGEQIQSAFPGTNVVKTLNTVNCAVMVDPASIPGGHALFICGNDDEAKASVADLLAASFGWNREDFFDLGDISNARGTEMYVALWLRMWGRVGHPFFSIKIVHGSG